MDFHNLISPTAANFRANLTYSLRLTHSYSSQKAPFTARISAAAWQQSSTHMIYNGHSHTDFVTKTYFVVPMSRKFTNKLNTYCWYQNDFSPHFRTLKASFPFSR